MSYNEKELLDKMEREKAEAAAALPPKKESVGEVLRKAREASGKDISYISDYLKIKPQYLKSIEEDKFNSLPGQAYVIGFIKSYASFLGLDAGRLLEEYKAVHMASAGHESPLEDDTAVLENPLVNSNHIILFGFLCLVGIFSVYIFRNGDYGEGAEEPAVAVEMAPAEERAPPEPPAAGVPVSYTPIPRQPQGDFYSVEIVDDSLQPPSVPARPVEPVHEEAAIAAPPVDESAVRTAARRPAEYGTANGDDSRITIAAKDRVWVKLKRGGFFVYDDGAKDRDAGSGEVVFEAMLEPGDRYRVPDAPGLYLTIGNAQALDIIADGEAVPPMSPRAISRHNIEMDVDKLKAGTAYVRNRAVE